jgi:RNA polymerase sigma factor (sigma-70 family)
MAPERSGKRPDKQRQVSLDGYPWRLFEVAAIPGDGSFQAFVRHYSGVLRRSITYALFGDGGMQSRLANWQDVEEVLQNTWVALLQNDARALRTFDPTLGSGLHGYLGMLARREAHNFAMRRTRLKRGGLNGEVLTPPESGTMLTAPALEVGPERLVGGERQRDRVLGALKSRLSPRGWLYFTLLYEQELKPTEVARLLQVKLNLVHKWQERIRRCLKEILVALETP